MKGWDGGEGLCKGFGFNGATNAFLGKVVQNVQK